MELEFIEVNLEGRSRTFNHFYPHGPGCNPGFFQWVRDSSKIISRFWTVYTVRIIANGV